MTQDRETEEPERLLATQGRNSMFIIPAIDLKDGQGVRLSQGRRSDLKVYDSDPVGLAHGLEAGGARMLHVVDLDGAFAGLTATASNRQVVREIIRAVRIPVQCGGGLRTSCDVEQLLGFGAARVVIGTLAVESPATLENFVRLFGGGRVCVGIDARDGQVMTRGWERQGGIRALELARRVRDAGVERIIYTDVARDGMLEGVNVEQTCAVARESGLKVTASGGVSSLEDIERLKMASACGVDSVIIGKALYEGRFTLEEALRAS